MTRFTSVAALLIAAPLSISAVAPAAVPVVAPIAMPATPVAMAPEPAAPLVSAAIALKAGDFSWAERSTAPVDAGTPVLIAVSIADQRLYAFRGGALFAVSTVSTGRPGHATPLGAFPITEKHREHHSNKYNNASMPFMQRLTNDGVALHAGRIPGHPASHGCVRLPLAFAEKLFGVTSRGGMVVITDQPLAALAARDVMFDGRTVQAIPTPAPLPATAPTAVAAATLATPPSTIAAAFGATLDRLHRWMGN